MSGHPGDFAVATRLTGTTQGSPAHVQSEGTEAHKAEQGQGVDTHQGQHGQCTGTTRHESWVGIVSLWVGLVHSRCDYTSLQDLNSQHIWCTNNLHSFNTLKLNALTCTFHLHLSLSNTT